jgi:hypothetical protein
MALPKRAITFCAGVAAGALMALPLYAQVVVSWAKAEIVPMLAVQPDPLLGFVPVEGSKGANIASGNVWSKGQVVPVVIVQPDPVWGFIPVEDSKGTNITMGQYWAKEQVKPIVFVRPSAGIDFIPAEPPRRF